MKKKRLAGIHFEPQSPVPDDSLPRMDIAVFVGFAARGVLQTPVAVESAEEFSANFGDDLELAWDQRRGVVVRAYLAPAVRAFFRNGGRRCWVIRLPVPAPGKFSAASFLDSALIDVISERLLGEADYIRYQAESPRELTGIHAAMAIEEATIIAVPDLVHLGWQVVEDEELPKPISQPPLDRLQWHPHPHCVTPPEQQRPDPLCPNADEPEDKPEEQTALEKPMFGAFLDCDVRVIEVPKLKIEIDGMLSAVQGVRIFAREKSLIKLKWTVEAEPDAHFVVQEATRPDFSDAVTLYAGVGTEFPILGRALGDYFYQVRAEVGEQFSDWSKGVVVRLTLRPNLVQNAAADFDDVTLLLVHRALLQLCAARGDIFAVLSLPAHFQPQAALDYSFKVHAGIVDSVRSYGALFHPWLVGREEHRPEELRITPPDGAICGVMAKRARERGAWIAPANETLSGVMALTPAIERERYLALDLAHVNLIRQEPRGFLTLSADTLSGDFATPSDDLFVESELELISVRRLLILLRRLALREGSVYVFEPNDDSFRRMVKRNFESFLERLFVRGAFAGRSSTSAYRVVTDNTINTVRTVDQGRFFVELMVAPSQPLKFLTVRLLHSGDQLLVSEVGR